MESLSATLCICGSLRVLGTELEASVSPTGSPVHQQQLQLY